MPEVFWKGIALVHLGMIAALMVRVRLKGRRVGLTSVLGMLLLPVFGPVVGWMLWRSRRRTPPDAARIQRNEGIHRRLISPASETAGTIPMEEALFIHDPKHRRALILSMLKTDPRKHLDVLLVARFDEDPETSHYATATLMKIQRQIQQELQELQAMIRQNPADENAWNEYLALMDEYCSSGLVGGHLLRRERLQLASAANQCLSRMATPERLGIAVRNHLALNQVREARAAARQMCYRWPHDERSWLEMMRVCVHTRDPSGMNALMEQALRAPVDWTLGGREKLKYWMKRPA